MTSAAFTRSDAEDFLYAEARLLEAGDLDAWLGLFEAGGRYQIPTTDAPEDADPAQVQFFIADDWELLQARIVRLTSRGAHAENPRSHTHRMIANVTVDAVAGDEWRIRASFVVHRIRDGRVDPYLGRYDHRVVVGSDGPRFRVRRSILAVEQLRPGGRLSFIL
jgi:p-cumate 2,3-dioxygenase beta subunit